MATIEIKRQNLQHPLIRQVEQIRIKLDDFSRAKPIDLPESAKPFLIRHAWLNKTRQIPDFRKLLAEKIRWVLVNKIMERVSLDINWFAGDLLGIADEYERNSKLYKEVEDHDIPMYWEANDKLTDFNVDRAVVFGRDGRYFFTALKALDFGIGEKDLKYVIITRGMRDNGESERKINDYLRQNGVGLEFTFIDTGFAGTIPKLAIDALATAGGVDIPADEIDKKIMLLSSSDPRRRELSRRRINDRHEEISRINTIEDRPQNMESPRFLDIDDKGNISPRVVPTDIKEQLRAWVVEHVSLRNFAPRLDPEKRISYLKNDPLKGYKYVEDLRSTGAISTHPVEIWEDEGGHRVVIKGGPRHTIQADLLGQRFLKTMGVKVPDTEIIDTEQGPKLKMEVLKSYKPGGIHLPDEFRDDQEIKKGLLVDALLGQYDRTPWNLMFNEGTGQVAFIDNGAGVFSRARGGHKGFPDYFDIEQLQEILSSPQFPGEPVNEAYDNFVKVKDGEVVISDHFLMRRFMHSFAIATQDEFIDKFVEQAGYLDGRRSVADAEATIEELTEQLNHLDPDSSDYRKTQQAIETYRKVMEAEGQATYVKRALKQRRDDIVAMFEKIVGSKS